MSEQILLSIEAKLDTIIRLFASMIIDGAAFEEKTNKDKILKLNELGLDRNLIATILGTTPLYVSVIVSQSKTTKSKKKTKTKKETEQEQSKEENLK